MSREVFGQTYTAAYDILYHDKEYEAECDLLEEIFRGYGGGRVQSILDLGCGTGNHANILTQRGYHVIGVDRSAEMVAHAQRKVQNNLSSATQKVPLFLRGDARSLNLNQKFDAVLMMFAVLGYQLNNEDVLATLRTVRNHLRPSGLFVCDVWYGPAVLTLRPTDRVKVIPTTDGKVIRAASGKLDIYRHLCEIRYKVWCLNAQKVVSESEETHWMRYFFPQELSLFMRQEKLRLLDMRSFIDLAQPPSDATWNVLVIGKSLNEPV